MRRRWWIYGLIGLGFGIVDWYYLGLFASLGHNQAFLALNDRLNQASSLVRLLVMMLLISLNYGIWLVPVIPAAIYEMRRSQSHRQAALASALVWAAAMVSYYTFYAMLLMFVGLPQMEFMLYSNHLSPGYWADWWVSFRNLILGQFLMWVAIALVAGPVVGILSAGLFKKLAFSRKLKRSAT